MPLISSRLRTTIQNAITGYSGSQLESFVMQGGGAYAVKFINSALAVYYENPSPLHISSHPLLTWGTGTYVTPLLFPLSSALYGRVGIVSDYDPQGWKIFDATDPRNRALYIQWAQAQPAYNQLMLTVHSTLGNRALRNRFKEDFAIDCVLFRPDQTADLHTNTRQDVWMVVTDWENGRIATGKSTRLAKGRFTVLIDEDFVLQDANQLPVDLAKRQIEEITLRMSSNSNMAVTVARRSSSLPQQIINHYNGRGYLHVYIEP